LQTEIQTIMFFRSKQFRVMNKKLFQLFAKERILISFLQLLIGLQWYSINMVYLGIEKNQNQRFFELIDKLLEKPALIYYSILTVIW